MAQVRVDWRTFAQVEAGRPFYPLFKDEVPIELTLLEPNPSILKRRGTDQSVQYPSAYNQYIPTTVSDSRDCFAYSPDVLVVRSNDPDTVIVTTRPESVFDTGTEYTLTRILNLLSTLRAKGLASVKHIADLRMGDGNQRLGIVLQEQMTADGAAGGIEELVRGLALTTEDSGEGSECCDMDDEGWSYI